jgi:TPR repeat protein
MSNLVCGFAEFDRGNYALAFTLLMPIAIAGKAESQCLIANMYQLGLAVELNILTAIEWYEKSAHQGYGVAANNLGEIFFAGGDGVSVDRIQAAFWLEKARQQGFIHTRRLELS